MEPEFSSYNVVCHTSDCENLNQVICVLSLLNNPSVVCGPCGQLITDVTPVSNPPA